MEKKVQVPAAQSVRDRTASPGAVVVLYEVEDQCGLTRFKIVWALGIGKRTSRS